MKISVIVPVYNVENYISECIDSVTSQSHQDYELILIDDGSSDNSGLICDNYQLRNPKQVIVTHTKNTGVLQARLLGVKIASGEVLVFLDSDDCLQHDALRNIINCFTEYKCDMAMYDAGPCDKYETKEVRHPYLNGQVFEGEAIYELYKSVVLECIPNSVCLKAVRKECAVFPEYFSEFSQVKHGEDLLMSAHLITNSKKIVYLAQPLYHYRSRQGSAVNSYSPSRFESVKIVHKEIEKCIEAWRTPELKPLHCRRKVKGCIDTLMLLYRYRDGISKSDLWDRITAISEDPYFLSAYLGLEHVKLTFFYKMVADCLKKKRYYLLSVIMLPKKLSWKVQDILSRRY